MDNPSGDLFEAARTGFWGLLRSYCSDSARSFGQSVWKLPSRSTRR